PLVISWGYNALFPSHSSFLDYHQMNGSRDYTAFLTLPAAIDFMEKNNWWQVAETCRDLVKRNENYFSELTGYQNNKEIDRNFILQMFSAKISTPEPEKLQRYLYENYRIEIPAMRHGNDVWLRYSINAFN